MPPERVIILLSFLSHNESAVRTDSMCPGFAGFPNRPRLKLTVFQTVSNASVVNSWGTRPISERVAR